MKVCLLIGFEYTGNMFLPGIEQDLIQISKLVSQIQPDRLTVLSDISSKKLQDLGILQETKTLSFKKFKSTRKFLKIISRTVTHSDEVFLYYTGHAKRGNFLLPNDDKVKMSKLRTLLTQNTNPNSEILCLLDCCESTGLNLGFELTKHVKQTSKSPKASHKKIICISSSSEGQRSICTKSGSVFTTQLCKRLRKRKLELGPDLREMIVDKLHKTFKKKLGIKVTSCGIFEKEFGIASMVLITLSRPDLVEIWPWCVGKN